MVSNNGGHVHSDPFKLNRVEKRSKVDNGDELIGLKCKNESILW